MKKRSLISQREARELKRRVADLERQEDLRRNCYAQSYPGGMHIGALSVAIDDYVRVSVARRLKHAVVCTTENGVIQLYALPLGSAA
ncbi:hypothetical protein CS053_08565 [Rhodanobacter glycinis]|uniref:Uncharacterized protein n=1 Tax=Rhodanobacter glycinis TaxID=582702 RepID=A0A5B9DYB2_9GAMM|nr:hypothetical protein [Rhodanobacter glycinis]QEE24549.1 hypothetical protein CS053_08565 [Rhodanobacter glycinis]